MNQLTTTIARWLFCLPVILFGVNHLMGADKMAGMVPSYMPGSGSMWVYISGVILIACGLMLALDKMGRMAGFIIAGFLLFVVLTVHVPSAMASDEMTKMMGFVSVLKDTIIIGGALTLAGLSKK